MSTERRVEAVVKVGGSLAARPSALRRTMVRLAALAARQQLVVVPGGGPFADAVRRADRRFHLDDAAAHWMAVLAMDQYAHLLAGLAGAASVVRDESAIAAAIGAERLPVLAPSALLLATDPLPHSWQVTSDSIAAWLARQFGASLLVLLKDVDGVCTADPRRQPAVRLLPQVRREELREGIVDAHFARLLSPSMRCWIVNGFYPERLARLLAVGTTTGTEIV
jgi:aspartokinase-like uncharacterized kinase